MASIVHVHPTRFPTGDTYTVTISLSESEAIRLVQTNWLEVLGQSSRITWKFKHIRLQVVVSDRNLLERLDTDAASWVFDRLKELLS